MKIYLDNVKKAIMRNMRLAGIDTADNRDIYLDKIIDYCQNIKNKPFTLPKSAKTRHG